MTQGINQRNITGNKPRKNQPTSEVYYTGFWKIQKGVWDTGPKIGNNIIGARNTNLGKASESATSQKIMDIRPEPHQTKEV